MNNADKILNELISELGLNKSSFSKKIGIKSQALQSYFNGNTQTIKYKFANRIIKAFPNVRINFLMQGEKPIFKGVSNDSNQKDFQNYEKKGVTLEENELLKRELQLEKEKNKILEERISLLLGNINSRLGGK